MFNVLFDHKYIHQKRVFLTKKIKHSKILTFLIFLSIKFKAPLSKSLVFSGPHMRMNNVLKTFKNKNFSINKIKFDNTYIVTFNKKTEKILLNLLENKKSKILIGPLYDTKYQKKLVDYTNNYPNIKKIVASKNSLDSALNIFNDLKKENVYISPSGIASESEINKNINLNIRNDNCIVYFKKRPDSQLNFVTNFLEYRKIKYKLFQYGEYKNKDLITEAKKSKFGIYLSCSESQGFAVQEIMSCNLPLYVWDDLQWNSKLLMKYFKTKEIFITGSSVSFWNDQNGIKVENQEDFEKYFDKFINNIEKYNPTEIIKEKLTYEVSRKKLQDIFNSI